MCTLDMHLLETTNSYKQMLKVLSVEPVLYNALVLRPALCDHILALIFLIMY